MSEIQDNIRQIIGQILSVMEIRKVISIDDFYTSAGSRYEDAVALFQMARSNRHIEYSALIPESVLDADEGVWTRRLESYWVDIGADIRLAILDEIATAIEYKELPSDVRDLSLLRSFIPEDLFVALPPNEWKQKRKDIISEAQVNGKVLCLFDQDLRIADLPENAGLTLLQQTLHAQDENGHVICGLLTQTLRKDDEIIRARELAQEFNLRLDEFLPLSKDRLRGDPMDFADGLKMAVLNYARERLSKQVKDLTEQANREAQRRINDIDVYDFEHIVVRSSEQEGVWEPDTLFRLFDLFRYSNFRTIALEPERRALIYGTIERMRMIRNIETSESWQHALSDTTHRIRRIELYDDPDLLNPAHQPVDLGDIFEVGDRQYYILLAQPCDLMIRSKGERGTELVSLVRVRTLENNESEPEGISSFRLDHFELEPTRKTFVKFRTSIQISLDILDLSVFNGDGRCRMSLPEANINNYPTLHMPWRNRFAKLIDYYQTTNTEFARIPYLNVSNYQAKALRKLLTCSNKDINLRYDATGVFEFGMRRVARLRSPLSVELLGAYYSFLSRNPREHDFSRV